MRVDDLLVVSDAQAVTTTAVSTDSIALGATGLNVGSGEYVELVIQVDVAALVAGTETYSFQLVSATASNLTSGQTILAEREFSTAQAAALTAGTRWTIGVPSNVIPTTATHIGARYETANSAGITVTAFIQPAAMVQVNRAPFRSGFTVAS